MKIHSQNLKTSEVSTFFWTRQASFGQLGLISDPDINFKKSQDGLSDHKVPENTNYTIVKYGKTFYRNETLFFWAWLAGLHYLMYST